VPAEISESYLSRPFTLGQNAGFELIWDISGTEDDVEVETILRANTPGAYRGRAIESVEADPLGGGKWKGIARYSRLENDDELTFDTTGGTTKITQSLGTIGAYGIGGMTPPDFKGAIGVSEDRVEGVDINLPALSFSITKRFKDAIIVGGYVRTLLNLTARTNSMPFKGHDTGEVLFLGANGAKRGDEDWTINFKFAVSENQSGLTLGDITDIAKGGWEYLWCRYADFADTSSFALVKRPIAVYVERVYFPGNFLSLLLGP
jgi:hypothetical protein